MAGGSLTLSNLTDEQFIKLLQIKDKSPGKLFFPANQTVTPTTIPGLNNVQTPGFTNVVLVFNDGAGAKVAAEVLEMIAT